MLGPDYLNGVSHRWNPGAGQAPIQYDYHQIAKIERKIAKLRNINTAHVQLEYIANKPEGKGGPGLGVKKDFKYNYCAPFGLTTAHILSTS
jgi:hypothetical protein